MASEAKRLRIYDKLPVIICEWHQHVLPHIHRGIASRHLPSTGLNMLHFDAHPDLTFPLTMPASACFDKEALYDRIEIADWILPLCYEGHLHKVTWMRPEWADQIKDGKYFVKVGEDKKSGCLRVNWKDDYFLEELLYTTEDSFVHAKDVKIQVNTLYDISKCTEKCIPGKGNSDKVLNPESIHNLKGNDAQKCYEECFCKNRDCWLLEESFILDIDLDFFSTYNPFRLHFSKDDFQTLTEIFKFESPKTLSEEHVVEATTKRQDQLKKLEMTILYFAQAEKLLISNESFEFFNLINDITIIVKEDEIDKQYYELLQRIKNKQRRDGKDIDLELMHFAGMSSELPHHKSTTEEINTTLLHMKNFLMRLPKPQLITIARSSEDDYTPSDQVNFIQEEVIQMLEQLYGEISVVKDYET